MKKLQILVWFSLWFILFVPFATVMYKLLQYLINNPFKESWISIIWVIIFPLASVVIFFYTAKEATK